MNPTIFIHTSSHEILSAKVAAFSHRVFSKKSDELEVRIIQIEDYPNFTRHHGEMITRFGKEAAWYKDVPQSFLPLRFIVPQLMNFEGRAVLTDPDIFATADIMELFQRDMQGKAICSRRFGKALGGFNSSVMLLDCAKLSHWHWDEMIESIFRREVDLQDFITLRFEPEEMIGELEECWNDYDQITGNTKLLHTTRQITQPWKTGLPFKIENMNNNNREVARSSIDKILDFREKGKRKLLNAIKNTVLHGEPQVYQRHPDEIIEKLFLSLLNAALEAGFINQKFIQSEIKLGHVRRDILRMLQSVNESPSEIISNLKSNVEPDFTRGKAA